MNERKMVATESTESFLARVKSVAHKLDKGEPVARSLTISYGEPAEPLQSLHLIEEAAMNSVRDEARKLVEQLPDGASWDDLMYQIYVRQKIDAGRKAIAEGRFVTQEQLEKQIAAWPDR